MELPYLKQNCELTLNEGLEMHYAADSSFKENLRIAPVFYNHDIAHVFFGLTTSIEHESLVDIRVIFGTNWGLKKYFNDYYKNPDAKKIVMKIFEDMGYVRAIILSMKSIPKILKVIINCKKMTKKWKLDSCSDLLNTKLSVLRKEYNVAIIN